MPKGAISTMYAIRNSAHQSQKIMPERIYGAGDLEDGDRPYLGSALPAWEAHNPPRYKDPERLYNQQRHPQSTKLANSARRLRGFKNTQ